MELNLLPDELLHVLFSYFSLPTLLASCCLVCKRWRALVYQMRIRELYFKNRVKDVSTYEISTSYVNFWSSPNRRSVDPRYLVRIRKPSFFDSSTVQMFMNLKRLQVYGHLNDNFDFDKLNNQFTGLEELAVTIILIEQEEKAIRLPNLKVLDCLFSCPNSPTKLIIDCPKLLYLYFKGNFRSLFFTHPETVERLASFSSFTSTIAGFDFSQFKNVRIYYHNEAWLGDINSNPFFENILACFPALEELHYKTEKWMKPGQATEERVKEKFRRILEKKIRLKRMHLRIFFQGIEVTGRDLLDSFKLNELHHIQTLQCQNHELLTDDPFNFNQHDYNISEKHFGNSLPSDLLAKFTNVNIVRAESRISYPDQFAWFLRGCRNLCYLITEISSLDQMFYDQLHVNCRYLRKLELKIRKSKKGNARNDKGEELSLDFLATLTNLNAFVAHFNLQMDDAIKLVRNLRRLDYLHYLQFNYHKHEISVKKSVFDLYSLNCQSQNVCSNFRLRTNFIKMDKFLSSLEFVRGSLDK